MSDLKSETSQICLYQIRTSKKEISLTISFISFGMRIMVEYSVSILYHSNSWQLNISSYSTGRHNYHTPGRPIHNCVLIVFNLLNTDN